MLKLNSCILSGDCPDLLQLGGEDGQGVVAQEVDAVKVAPAVGLTKALKHVEHLGRLEGVLDVQKNLKVCDIGKTCGSDLNLLLAIALKLLQACIYKSVYTGLFSSSLWFCSKLKYFY